MEEASGRDTSTRIGKYREDAKAPRSGVQFLEDCRRFQFSWHSNQNESGQMARKIDSKGARLGEVLAAIQHSENTVKVLPRGIYVFVLEVNAYRAYLDYYTRVISVPIGDRLKK